MATSTPNPPQSLTFGLEIEMIVPGRPPALLISRQEPDFQDPHVGDARWYAKTPHLEENQRACEEAVAQCLARAGLTNLIVDGNYDPAQTSHEALTSQIWLPNIPVEYHHWQIIHDQSCQCEEWVANDEILGRYSWSAVEIASAVFRSRAWPDNWIAVTAEQQARLGQICRSLTSNMRLRLSQSCGLHVHLGLGGDPIPPDTVRRFVTTMWLIEDAVLTLCAPWRQNNYYSQPITKYSMLAKNQDVHRLRQRFSPAPADTRILIDECIWQRMSPLQQGRVRLIWALPLERLRSAVCTRSGSSRGSVSIRGCCGNIFGCPVQNTIEIRYGSSTLVAAELTSWTNIFVRLFQLCNYYNDVNAVRLTSVLRHVTDALAPGSMLHAGHELLRQLELGDDVPVWTAAQQRWALENDHDHIRKSPFADPQ